MLKFRRPPMLFDNDKGNPVAPTKRQLHADVDIGTYQNFPILPTPSIVAVQGKDWRLKTQCTIIQHGSYSHHCRSYKI